MKVSALASMKISKNRLQDNVYEQLRDLILNGEIAAGQIILVQTLSEMFGVSVMPVREALQRLVAMQALTVVSGRSVGVPPLTQERLTDLNRVRIVFEGATAEWAVDNMSSAAIDQLEYLTQGMGKAIEHQDIKSFLRLNREFHFSIYKLSGSEAACTVIERFWLQMTPYWHQLYTVNRYEKASANHEIIVNALKARDRWGVGYGIREDIRSGTRVLVNELASQAQKSSEGD